MLKIAKWLEKIQKEELNPERKIKYWCQDETRLGLKTSEKRKITARGVKPIGKVQWKFSAYYLYGVISPKDGDSFFLEFSHLDSKCFQVFLNQVSQYSPDCLNIIQLDNGSFHRSQSLKIPENILLIFQPPASPELNPIERLWQYLKQRLTWRIYENLDRLKEEVRTYLKKISSETIISLASWDYIIEALSVV